MRNAGLKEAQAVQLFAILCPRQSLEFSSQNTGVGSLSLLQGIFPAQGSNPGLPNWRKILYQLSHKGSPRILEWVANPFSSRPSRPRTWTRVSCIAGGFFTNRAVREPSGREYEQTHRDSEGQGSLACCSPRVAESRTRLSGWRPKQPPDTFSFSLSYATLPPAFPLVFTAIPSSKMNCLLVLVLLFSALTHLPLVI